MRMRHAVVACTIHQARIFSPGFQRDTVPPSNLPTWYMGMQELEEKDAPQSCLVSTFALLDACAT
jgi:hypothetical protein